MNGIVHSLQIALPAMRENSPCLLVAYSTVLVQVVQQASTLQSLVQHNAQIVRSENSLLLAAMTRATAWTNVLKVTKTLEAPAHLVQRASSKMW